MAISSDDQAFLDTMNGSSGSQSSTPANVSSGTSSMMSAPNIQKSNPIPEGPEPSGFTLDPSTVKGWLDNGATPEDAHFAAMNIDPNYKAAVNRMSDYNAKQGQNSTWMSQYPKWQIAQFYDLKDLQPPKSAANPVTQHILNLVGKNGMDSPSLNTQDQAWLDSMNGNQQGQMQSQGNSPNNPNTQGPLGSFSVEQAQGQGLKGIGMGLANIGLSGARFGLNAAKTIGQTALGAEEQEASAVSGQDINDPFNSKGVAQNVEGSIGNMALHPIATLNAIKDHYVKTYGSPDAALKKIFEDPAGFLSDVVAPAQVATGGLSLAGKLGFTSAGNLADTLSNLQDVPGLGTVGNAVDKTVAGVGNASTAAKNATTNAVSGLAKGTIGGFTGAGKGAVDEAMNSTGFNDAFHQAMRGDPADTMNKVVDEAQKGINTLSAQRAAQYAASKTSVAGSAAEIDPATMGDVLKKQLDSFGIQGGVEGNIDAEVKGMNNAQSARKLNEMVQGGGQSLDFSKSNIADTTANNADKARVTEATQIVKNAMTSDDPYYKTPLGWDTVKKQLGSLVKNDGSPADSFITGLKNNVRDEITSQTPEYGKMMSDYENASQNLSDIKKAFSLQGGARKAALDTVVRKFTSSMRTGNQGNEIRNALLTGLEESTGVDIKGALGGAAMNAWTPRGLAGVAEGAATGAGVTAVLAHLINPALLLALPLSSPRIAGEMLGALGIAKNAIKPILSSLASKIPAGTTAVAAQAANYANPPNGQ